jgi:U3 small nucleolar RNA-associated protein 10
MNPKKNNEGQSLISPLVAQLIALATVETNSNLDDIREAARSSLNRLLSTMSVVDYIESVQSILLSEDVKVLHLLFTPCFFFSLFGQIQSGAFDVLAKRLPDVSARIRPNIKDNIKQLLQLTKNFLHINKNGDSLTFAFQALKSIADTLCAGEEGSLADLVPYVLSSMNDKDLAFSALSALSSISYVPSCIPHIFPE